MPPSSSPLPPLGDEERDFDRLFREYIREELRDVNTAALAIVESVDHRNMRVEISMKHDRGIDMPDVPIATPYTRNGHGDRPGLTPGDEGLVLFLATPTNSGLLAKRGHIDTPNHRDHRVDDAVFFPGMIWYDNDAIPPHDNDPAERTLTHRGGGELRMHTGRTELSHGAAADESRIDRGDRVRLRLTDDPYHTRTTDTDPTDADSTSIDDIPAWRDTPPQDTSHIDPEHAYDAHQLWPRAHEPAAVLDHPSGTYLMLTEQGMGVVPGERDTGTRRRGLVLGALNDPERVHVAHHRHELAAPHAPVTDESVTTTGDDTATVTLDHSLGSTPGHVDVTARNANARGQFHVADKTATDVTIEYDTARTSGDTLEYDILSHPPRDADETVSLTTEPLSHREQTMRLADVDTRAEVANVDTDDVAAAVTRAENAVAFLSFYGPEVDPSDAETWPAIEYVPDTAEWAAWDDDAYDPATFTPDTDDQRHRGLDIDEPLDGGLNDDA